MAGYVKIWTTIDDNEEFLSLNASQRGVYLQLLIQAKKGRDDGTVAFRNWSTLGTVMGCDPKTIRKSIEVMSGEPRENSRKIPGEIPEVHENGATTGQVGGRSGRKLGNFPVKSLVEFEENDYGVIILSLPNYRYWQDIDVKKVTGKIRKYGKNPGKIPPLRPDQTRPDQSRADQSILNEPPKKPKKKKIPDTEHHKAIEYWCKLYEERFGNKYDFKGQKEGPIVKRLLELYKFEKCCQLFETFLNTNDPFYRKTGWTLGVLSSQTNKLLQKPILANDPLSKFSPAAQQTILNMREILEKDKQDAGK